jgi:hypothetical protein
VPDDSLDRQLDELYATPPDQFVAARDGLARDLERDGRDDDAATVKALRRPTVAVAAVNRAARERPDLVAELVDTGAELAHLQSGKTVDRNELRDLTRRRRAVLAELTGVAATPLARPDGARSSITATFDTASTDDALREQLLAGRLTHELAPTARFVPDDGESSRTSAPSPTRRAAHTTRAAPPRDELAVRRARAQVGSLRERVETAEETAHERAEELTDATAALDAARRHIADLDAALAEARAALVDAKRDERTAQRAAERARTEHERATTALQAAERAADRAD